MRILGGRFRGRRLKMPRGSRLRPSSGRLREALFSILGSRVPGARFLDLFAGTGAAGFEALSRGASHSVFVDSDPRAAEAIRSSAEEFEVPPEEFSIRQEDALAALRSLGERGMRFDLVFADPPYGWRKTSRLLEALRDSGVLETDGRFVLEHAKRAEAESVDGLELVRRETYGDSCVSIYRPVSPGPQTAGSAG